MLCVDGKVARPDFIAFQRCSSSPRLAVVTGRSLHVVGPEGHGARGLAAATLFRAPVELEAPSWACDDSSLAVGSLDPATLSAWLLDASTGAMKCTFVGHTRGVRAVKPAPSHPRERVCSPVCVAGRSCCSHTTHCPGLALQTCTLLHQRTGISTCTTRGRKGD